MPIPYFQSPITPIYKNLFVCQIITESNSELEKVVVDKISYEMKNDRNYITIVLAIYDTILKSLKENMNDSLKDIMYLYVGMVSATGEIVRNSLHTVYLLESKLELDLDSNGIVKLEAKFSIDKTVLLEDFNIDSIKRENRLNKILN